MSFIIFHIFLGLSLGYVTTNVIAIGTVVSVLHNFNTVGEDVWITRHYGLNGDLHPRHSH